MKRERQSCETKPIALRAGPAGQVPGEGKCAKRTQLPEAGYRGGVSIANFGLRIADWGRPASGRPSARALATQSCKTNPIGWRESCETNPISPERPGIGAGCRGPEGKLCKTKPNLGGLGQVGKGGHGMWAGSPESGMRKTNPIPGGRDTPPFHYPSFQTDADYAKRSQFPPWRRNETPLFALFSPAQVVRCANRLRWAALFVGRASPHDMSWRAGRSPYEETSRAAAGREHVHSMVWS
jgi:hypothetical protein